MEHGVTSSWEKGGSPSAPMKKATKISLEEGEGFLIFPLVEQGFPLLCGLAEQVVGN